MIVATNGESPMLYDRVPHGRVVVYASHTRSLPCLVPCGKQVTGPRRCVHSFSQCLAARPQGRVSRTQHGDSSAKLG